MKCPREIAEGAEVLLAFSARELDAERTVALEDHIRTCPECSGFVAAQRSVNEALEAWETPLVSADFDRRLYRRIELEVPWWDFLVRPFRPAVGGQWLPVATAVGLLLAVGLWIERPGEMPSPPTRSAQVEALPPEQAEHALQEMEIMQEFSRLIRSDSAEPRM